MSEVAVASTSMSEIAPTDTASDGMRLSTPLSSPARPRLLSDESPPWSRFKEWIHAICVVTFDLELGQALEVMYPGDAQLSGSEKTNICYLAFPDSNSGSSKDTKYHFRIRRNTNELTASQMELTVRCPPAMPYDPYFLYGFVHFRQQRDASLPRGYFQKSVVLISVLPFIHLFSAVVEKIAIGFFEIGEPAIEAACHHIDDWPRPLAGRFFRLPLTGSVIECRIPSACDLPLGPRTETLSATVILYASNFTKEYDNCLQKSDDADVIFLKNIYEPDLYKSLSTVVKHIQLLWELVLLGEPILVIANGPPRAAAIVQSLIALICPLKARVLLGVTNPFFVKALEHWPHILKFSDVDENSDSSEKKQEKARKNWDGRILDAKPGLFTHYKAFLTRDETLSKKLNKGSDRPDDVNSAVLQRHLLELTQSFMIPLERYLSTLMPLRKLMSPFKDQLNLKFQGLYRRFVQSASFSVWLSTRSSAMARQLKAAYVDALCEANLGRSVLSQRHHVEIVDLVLRIRQRLTEEDAGSEKRVGLTRQIKTILMSVDEELKSVLMSNCALRDIVG